MSCNTEIDMNDFNKNERQSHFNQIKGVIFELNDGERFCSITLSIGHENKRYVNLIVKKPDFDKIVQQHKIGDKIGCKFYLTSRNKSGRWYTMANALSVEKEYQHENKES